MSPLFTKSKSLIQYAAMIFIASVLVWLSLRNLTTPEGQHKTDFLWQIWHNANKGYLWIMVFTTLSSHVLRAYRWQMLLAPTNNKVSTGNSFLSLMIGYLVNVAIPRGGEVARCYNLLKLEKVPVSVSVGTVVTERIVDLLCLVLFTFTSFFIEWDKLKSFVFLWDLSSYKDRGIWLITIGLICCVGLVVYFFSKRNKKIKAIMEGFSLGLLSVFHLKRLSPFITVSVFMWVLYLLATFFIMEAFTATRGLGFGAAITLLTIGSIAIALPFPGGAGSYHTLMPLGLIAFYGIPKSEAIATIFIFHAWQTIITIASGFVSLIISYQISQWKKSQKK